MAEARQLPALSVCQCEREFSVSERIVTVLATTVAYSTNVRSETRSHVNLSPARLTLLARIRCTIAITNPAPPKS